MVILSGMDGLKINSMENMSRLKYLDGMSFDATLANRSALACCSLGIGEILNAKKWDVRSWTNDW